MAALNPLTHSSPAKLARALALDPATQAEERLTMLLYLWLARYFSGAAFQTLDPDGGTAAMTFTHCTFAFQEDELPVNPQKPQIHLVMPERKTRRLDYTDRLRGHDDDWTIDAMVKVPANLSGTGMGGTSAEAVARKVGGELEWLLDSTEREALVEAGVTRVRLLRPATLLPAGAWQMRMLVFSVRTRREQAKRRFGVAAGIPAGTLLTAGGYPVLDAAENAIQV